MDDITIEKAREIVNHWESPGLEGISCADYNVAKGFIKGVESQKIVIENLNKQIESLALQLRVKLAENVLRNDENKLIDKIKRLEKAIDDANDLVAKNNLPVIIFRVKEPVENPPSESFRPTGGI